MGETEGVFSSAKTPDPNNLSRARMATMNQSLKSVLSFLALTNWLSTSSASIVKGAKNSAQHACDYFNEALQSITTLPSESNYANLSTENWSATAWAQPACIVQPASVPDVQHVVRTLTQLQVQFAVRSGGHNPSPLAANINGGVLIDTSALNEVTYDSSSGTVRVGSGNTWGDVYSALDPLNVTVAGGRSVGVGVTGLTLGGGLSYFSDLYGLVCDNVAEHEVVLANGSLVKASLHENPELHWALKGGGNNFGIVTSFKFYTFASNPVWGGIKVYGLEQLPTIYAALAEYQTSPNKDPYANLDLQAAVTNSSIGVLLNLIYLKPVESPPAFKVFYEIPTLQDTTKIQTMTEFLTGGVLPYVPRWEFLTTTFTPSTWLYAHLSEMFTSSSEVSDFGGITGGTLVVSMQPISESLVLAGEERGGNALGLQPTNQTWGMFTSGWYSSEDDPDAHSLGSSLNNQTKKAAVNAGQHLPYVFMNDASHDQAVIASYGTENVKRMRDVQLKYDPGQVFQTLVPGGFKLP
ncbi:hypothetical protein KVR01_010589 [Diaporthe batatas]|uniref:uncharacterized protein n=1 Tax=Diaporthe batatas TaxID=748121 RepID=UPI001D05BF37|nr:uncharacterized protein KVR01_010589 [Diaporthe batatas]KAG8159952.1 hypothetical protein KVR01_010589 [Diaporthe batatas]